MASDKKLEQMAREANGRTYICSTCIFRTLIGKYPGCQQCARHFIEAYKKGYKQALRDAKKKEKTHG